MGIYEASTGSIVHPIKRGASGTEYLQYRNENERMQAQTRLGLLHGNTVASSTGRGVRVVALANRAPNRGYEVVASALAVVDQAGSKCDTSNAECQLYMSNFRPDQMAFLEVGSSLPPPDYCVLSSWQGTYL